VDQLTTVTVAVVTGVLSSMAASVLWLWSLRRVRPMLDIGPVAAEESSTRISGGFSYSFKLLNRSRRAVIDLKFELVVIRPKRTRGGLVDVRRNVEVLGTPPLSLAGFARGEAEAHNAYRLRTNAPLRQILEDYPDAYLRLRVMARDEVSGTGRVFEAKFHEPSSDIKSGKFARGQSFDIVAG
jgi:hypothetical protein